MVAVAVPFDISGSIAALTASAKKTYYAAQFFLPRDPFILAQNLTQDNASTSDRLRAILEANTGTGAPYTRNPREPADAAPDVGDIVRDSASRGFGQGLGIGTLGGGVNALEGNSRAGNDTTWLDIQRVGFLVLGLILVAIGANYIVRNVGDMSIDADLKRAQLKLTNAQLEVATKPIPIAEQQSQNKGGGKRIAAAAKRAADAARLPPMFFGNAGSGPIVDAKPRKTPPKPDVPKGKEP